MSDKTYEDKLKKIGNRVNKEYSKEDVKQITEYAAQIADVLDVKKTDIMRVLDPLGTSTLSEEKDKAEIPNLVKNYSKDIINELSNLVGQMSDSIGVGAISFIEALDKTLEFEDGEQEKDEEKEKEPQEPETKEDKTSTEKEVKENDEEEEDEEDNTQEKELSNEEKELAGLVGSLKEKINSLLAKEEVSKSDIKDLKGFVDNLNEGNKSPDNEETEEESQVKEALKDIKQIKQELSEKDKVLEEKDKVITTQEKKLSELKGRIQTFEDKQRKKKMAKQQAKFSKVLDKYCRYHGIESPEEVKQAKNRLATFSEAALREVEKTVERGLDNEPGESTPSSIELKQVKGDGPKVEEDKTTPENKIDELWEKAKNIN